MLQDAGFQPDMAARAAAAHAFKLDRPVAQCLRVAQAQDGGDRLLAGEMRADGSIKPDLVLVAGIVVDLVAVDEEMLKAWAEGIEKVNLRTPESRMVLATTAASIRDLTAAFVTIDADRRRRH